MMIGLLSDVQAQASVLPAAVVRALQAVQSVDVTTLPPGRYPIEGDEMFYLVQDATPRAVADSLTENHYQYADVQIPVSATERFGFSLPQPDLTASQMMFDTRDIALYPVPANEFFMDVKPGSYVVFLPLELHRPCVSIDNTTSFRKVVIKIHSKLLGLTPAAA